VPAEDQIQNQNQQQNAANPDPAPVTITSIPEPATEQEQEDQDDQNQIHSIAPLRRGISRKAVNSTCLRPLRLLRLRIVLGDGLKKKRDRHAQSLAHLIEAAGADTIFGLLVFV
jgi:hypothetical protein